MRSAPLCLTTALLIAGACTTTQRVARPDSVAALAVLAHAPLRPDGAGRKITVMLPAPEPIAPIGATPVKTSVLDGSPSPAPDRLVDVGALATSERISIPDGDRTLAVPLGDIRGVVVRRHGRGALEGAAIGLLAGAGTGALFGLSGDDPDRGCNPPDTNLCLGPATARDKAVLGALLLGAAGTALGLAIGLAVGQVDRYLF